jgi:hypothetical protein
MQFLNRVHHRSPMTPLELEMFHQINNVIGVDPEPLATIARFGLALLRFLANLDDHNIRHNIAFVLILNRVHHRSPMTPLELEMFHQINNVIGVDPELYEYCLMVNCMRRTCVSRLPRLPGLDLRCSDSLPTLTTTI